MAVVSGLSPRQALGVALLRGAWRWYDQNMRSTRLLVLLGAVVVAAGCGATSVPDAGSVDGGVRARADAAGDDGSALDASALDARVSDATAPDTTAPEIDAAAPDAAVSPTDASALDGDEADASAGAPDAGEGDASAGDTSVASSDATSADASAPDATSADAGPTYNCGAFTVDPGWTIQPGFHAVVVADATDGLDQPVALGFAGGAYGALLYSVNQGDNSVRATEVFLGTTTVLASAAALSPPPRLLTAVTWDRAGAFDGQLYVADQGTDADGDSRVYRIDATGVGTTFVSGPGPALDDVFGLVFSPGGAYPAGLYFSGDTDGAGPDWAVATASASVSAFSEVAGNEGIAVDTSGLFGGWMYSASPLGGGYPGDGSIAAVLPDGSRGATLASNLGGVHALAFSPGGAYGRDLYAARWDVGQLVRVTPAGVVSVIASGLSLTNYDANILAFSPDGNVLYVADRQADRIVCIEPL